MGNISAFSAGAIPTKTKLLPPPPLTMMVVSD